ncbi:MAG: cyclic pyranopterin monophosphate synthase MoaC [Deltaproteobacteria bacterium]|nr:cyclic pyranopterin monophosphate synthase MoaC [Deltaproteobacteria bacterium]
MRLTHLKKGEVHMVDVGAKAETERSATARGTITMSAAAMRTIRREGIKKGDLVATAKLAGILAAKRVPELIPLAHPIRLTGVEIEVSPTARGFSVVATARTMDRTGVEMEAVTAAAVALLTLYDMAKALDKGMMIGPVVLLEKRGGKSGTYRRRLTIVRRFR